MADSSTIADLVVKLRADFGDVQSRVSDLVSALGDTARQAGVTGSSLASAASEITKSLSDAGAGATVLESVRTAAEGVKQSMDGMGEKVANAGQAVETMSQRFMRELDEQLARGVKNIDEYSAKQGVLTESVDGFLEHLDQDTTDKFGAKVAAAGAKLQQMGEAARAAAEEADKLFDSLGKTPPASSPTPAAATPPLTAGVEQAAAVAEAAAAQVQTGMKAVGAAATEMGTAVIAGYKASGDASMTWREFVKANMSGAMAALGSHAAAMKELGVQWRDMQAAAAPAATAAEALGTTVAEAGREMGASAVDAASKLGNLVAGEGEAAGATAKLGAEMTKEGAGSAAFVASLEKTAERAGELGERVKETSEAIADYMAKVSKGSAAAAGVMDPSAAAANPFKFLEIQSTKALQLMAQQSQAAYEEIKNSGTATARDIQLAWIAMEERRQVAARASGEVITEEQKRALAEAQVLAAADPFKSLGVQSAESMRVAADAARTAYDQIAGSGTASARDIQLAWIAMEDRRQAAARASGEVITAEAQRALAQARAAASMTDVEAAFKQLGIQSTAALEQTAVQAKAAYDSIVASGTASAREVQLAWIAMEERRQAAAIASGQVISHEQQKMLADARTAASLRDLENAFKQLGLTSADSLKAAAAAAEAAYVRIRDSGTASAREVQLAWIAAEEKKQAAALAAGEAITREEQHALEEAKRAAEEFERAHGRAFDLVIEKAKEFGSKLSEAGKLLSEYVTAPLAALGTASFLAAESFEHAGFQVRATAGATGETLEKLEKNIENVLKATPASLDRVTAAITGIYQRLDITGEPLERLAQKLLILSDRLKVGIEPLVESTTKVFNLWRVATEDQGKALDFLLTASQKTGLGLTGMMSELRMSYPVLHEFGLNFQQAAALMSYLDKSGYQVTQQIMAMKMGMSRLVTEGVVPSVNSFKALIEQLRETDVQHGRMIAKTLFGARNWITLFEAIRAGRFNFEALTAEIYKNLDSVDAMGEQTVTLGHILANLRNRVEVALKPLGEPLRHMMEDAARSLRPFIDMLSSATHAFAQLTPETQKWILIIGGVAAGLGPALFTLGKVVTVGSAIAKFLPAIGEAFASMSGAATGAAATVGAAMTTLMSIITRVGAVGLATLAALMALRDLATLVPVVVDFVRSMLRLAESLHLVEVAGKLLQAAFAPLREGFSVIASGARTAWDLVVDGANQAREVLLNFLPDSVIERVERFGRAVREAFDARVPETFAERFERMGLWEKIQATAGPLNTLKNSLRDVTSLSDWWTGYASAAEASDVRTKALEATLTKYGVTVEKTGKSYAQYVQELNQALDRLRANAIAQDLLNTIHLRGVRGADELAQKIRQLDDAEKVAASTLSEVQSRKAKGLATDREVMAAQEEYRRAQEAVAAALGRIAEKADKHRTVLDGLRDAYREVANNYQAGNATLGQLLETYGAFAVAADAARVKLDALLVRFKEGRANADDLSKATKQAQEAYKTLSEESKVLQAALDRANYATAQQTAYVEQLQAAHRKALEDFKARRIGADALAESARRAQDAEKELARSTTETGNAVRKALSDIAFAPDTLPKSLNYFLQQLAKLREEAEAVGASAVSTTPEYLALEKAFVTGTAVVKDHMAVLAALAALQKNLGEKERIAALEEVAKKDRLLAEADKGLGVQQVASIQQINTWLERERAAYEAGARTAVQWGQAQVKAAEDTIKAQAQAGVKVDLAPLLKLLETQREQEKEIQLIRFAEGLLGGERAKTYAEAQQALDVLNQALKANLIDSTRYLQEQIKIQKDVIAAFQAGMKGVSPEQYEDAVHRLIVLQRQLTIQTMDDAKARSLLHVQQLATIEEIDAAYAKAVELYKHGDLTKRQLDEAEIERLKLKIALYEAEGRAASDPKVRAALEEINALRDKQALKIKDLTALEQEFGIVTDHDLTQLEYDYQNLITQMEAAGRSGQEMWQGQVNALGRWRDALMRSGREVPRYVAEQWALMTVRMRQTWDDLFQGILRTFQRFGDQVAGDFTDVLFGGGRVDTSKLRASADEAKNSYETILKTAQDAIEQRADVQAAYDAMVTAQQRYDSLSIGSSEAARKQYKKLAEDAKANYEAIKKAALEQVPAQDQVKAAYERMQKAEKEATDPSLWRRFHDTVISLMEDLGKSITKEVIGALLHASGLVEKLTAGFLKLFGLGSKLSGGLTGGGGGGIAGIGSEVAEGAIGGGGGSVGSTAASVAGAVGSSALGMVTSIASLGVNIASGIVQGIQGARMNNLLAEIEKSTRYTEIGINQPGATVDTLHDLRDKFQEYFDWMRTYALGTWREIRDNIKGVVSINLTPSQQTADKLANAVTSQYENVKDALVDQLMDVDFVANRLLNAVTKGFSDVLNAMNTHTQLIMGQLHALGETIVGPLGKTGQWISGIQGILGGGGGILGGIGGIASSIAGVASGFTPAGIVSGVISGIGSIFTGMHGNTLLGRIEESTRYMKGYLLALMEQVLRYWPSLDQLNVITEDVVEKLRNVRDEVQLRLSPVAPLLDAVHERLAELITVATSILTAIGQMTLPAVATASITLAASVGVFNAPGDAGMRLHPDSVAQLSAPSVNVAGADLRPIADALATVNAGVVAASAQLTALREEAARAVGTLATGISVSITADSIDALKRAIEIPAAASVEVPGTVEVVNPPEDAGLRLAPETIDALRPRPPAAPTLSAFVPEPAALAPLVSIRSDMGEAVTLLERIRKVLVDSYEKLAAIATNLAPRLAAPAIAPAPVVAPESAAPSPSPASSRETAETTALTTQLSETQAALRESTSSVREQSSTQSALTSHLSALTATTREAVSAAQLQARTLAETATSASTVTKLESAQDSLKALTERMGAQLSESTTELARSATALRESSTFSSTALAASASMRESVTRASESVAALRSAVAVLQTEVARLTATASTAAVGGAGGSAIAVSTAEAASTAVLSALTPALTRISETLERSSASTAESAREVVVASVERAGAQLTTATSSLERLVSTAGEFARATESQASSAREASAIARESSRMSAESRSAQTAEMREHLAEIATSATTLASTLRASTAETTREASEQERTRTSETTSRTAETTARASERALLSTALTQLAATASSVRESLEKQSSAQTSTSASLLASVSSARDVLRATSESLRSLEATEHSAEVSTASLASAASAVREVSSALQRASESAATTTSHVSESRESETAREAVREAASASVERTGATASLVSRAAETLVSVRESVAELIASVAAKNLEVSSAVAALTSTMREVSSAAAERTGAAAGAAVERGVAAVPSTLRESTTRATERSRVESAAASSRLTEVAAYLRESAVQMREQAERVRTLASAVTASASAYEALRKSSASSREASATARESSSAMAERTSAAQLVEVSRSLAAVISVVREASVLTSERTGETTSAAISGSLSSVSQSIRESATAQMISTRAETSALAERVRESASATKVSAERTAERTSAAITSASQVELERNSTAARESSASVERASTRVAEFAAAQLSEALTSVREAVAKLTERGAAGALESTRAVAAMTTTASESLRASVERAGAGVGAAVAASLATMPESIRSSVSTQVERAVAGSATVTASLVESSKALRESAARISEQTAAVREQVARVLEASRTSEARASASSERASTSITSAATAGAERSTTAVRESSAASERASVAAVSVTEARISELLSALRANVFVLIERSTRQTSEASRSLAELTTAVREALALSAERTSEGVISAVSGGLASVPAFIRESTAAQMERVSRESTAVTSSLRESSAQLREAAGRIAEQSSIAREQSSSIASRLAETSSAVERSSTTAAERVSSAVSSSVGARVTEVLTALRALASTLTESSAAQLVEVSRSLEAAVAAVREASISTSERTGESTSTAIHSSLSSVSQAIRESATAQETSARTEASALIEQVKESASATRATAEHVRAQSDTAREQSSSTAARLTEVSAAVERSSSATAERVSSAVSSSVSARLAEVLTVLRTSASTLIEHSIAQLSEISRSASAAISALRESSSVVSERTGTRTGEAVAASLAPVPVAIRESAASQTERSRTEIAAVTERLRSAAASLRESVSSLVDRTAAQTASLASSLSSSSTTAARESVRATTERSSSSMLTALTTVLASVLTSARETAAAVTEKATSSTTSAVAAVREALTALITRSSAQTVALSQSLAENSRTARTAQEATHASSERATASSAFMSARLTEMLASARETHADLRERVGVQMGTAVSLLNALNVSVREREVRERTATTAGAAGAGGVGIGGAGGAAQAFAAVEFQQQLPLIAPALARAFEVLRTQALTAERATTTTAAPATGPTSESAGSTRSILSTLRESFTGNKTDIREILSSFERSEMAAPSEASRAAAAGIAGAVSETRFRMQSEAVSSAASAASAQNPVNLIFNAPIYGGPAGLDQLSDQIMRRWKQRGLK